MTFERRSTARTCITAVVAGLAGAARIRWRYRLDAGRVRFERDGRETHRRVKPHIPRFLRESDPLTMLTAPVIYSLALPIALLDVWVTIFQAICFRVYGMDRVQRSTDIVIDRHRLAYLNGIEKLNCVFCGDANGVFADVREVASRTEQYWCPIRHAKRTRAPHPHCQDFVDFGDAAGYRQELPRLRAELRPKPPAGGADEPDRRVPGNASRRSRSHNARREARTLRTSLS